MVTFIVLAIVAFFFYAMVASIGASTSDTANSVRGSSVPQVQEFKKASLRVYELRGLKYRGIKDSDVRFFVGTARSTFNSHDRYAVEIVRDDGKRLGFIPKGNVRMSRYLSSRPDKSIICYGWIERQFGDNWENPYYGRVVIPVLCSQLELNALSRVLTIYTEVTPKLKEHKLLSLEDALKVLELDNEKRQLERDFPIIPNLSYTNIYNLMSGITSQLEKGKHWVQLQKLESLELLINELPERQKGAVIRKIVLAKSQLSKLSPKIT